MKETLDVVVVEAAITIQRELGPWCEAQQLDPPLTLKLGLHEGPVIAATANDRLDYLGRTANLAASLRDESRGGDVGLLLQTLEQPEPASLEDVPTLRSNVSTPVCRDATQRPSSSA